MLNNHIHDDNFLIIPFQMYNLFCYNCFTAASLSPVEAKNFERVSAVKKFMTNLSVQFKFKECNHP